MPLPFCRVCGQPVTNPRALMHPECLAADKARRAARKRAKDQKRFISWLGQVLKYTCEASHGARIIAAAEIWGKGRGVKKRGTLTP